MADHALTLMQAIQSMLDSQVSLAGGWLATRIETPDYPVGFIDLTSSVPVRGQAFYAEQHRGVVSVWSRKTVSTVPSPVEAFQLSEAAHRLLGSSVLSSGNLIVQQFQCGVMTPRSPDDGLTWGRSFVFTATTHEVHHG
ncbi:hypothetical protein [Paracoccus sp. DMF]|uniref:hypothetical protein n=1 Tax=Paracoccus sp. DMF TaxID=400837 RepID=UPI00110372D1|nr:hypothetical protein [Paracoccus sp. DMF]MCV2448460.1 hypothetical protein [Paracoccus sp. DMF]